MRTGTIDAPKDNTNHSVWRRLSVIAAAVSVAVLTVAAAPARAQTGPILNEVAKLLPDDGVPYEQFGAAIGVNDDTAIIGAYFDTGNGTGSGSAYVFTRDANGVWSQQAKLFASDGATGDGFGGSVAISGDTAVAGVPFDDDNGTDSGSAYVFVRDADGVWTQQAKLLAPDGAAFDRFGISVALVGDTALVGAWLDDDNGTDSGSAYVFTRDANGVWTQQTKLLSDDGAAGDRFGTSVALGGDTAVIGAFHDNDNGSASGSAYVFVRDANGVWTQQAKLLALDGAAGDNFGFCVDLSADTAIADAPGDDDNGLNSGSVYIFVRDSTGVWSQQTKLLPDDGAAEDLFGYTVAISGDRAVAGAPFDEDNGFASGSAYFFMRDAAGVWTQRAKLLASDGEAGDRLGEYLDMSGDTVVVGVRFDDDNGIASGSAYVFDLSPGASADLNDDGVVDSADLETLLGQWGTNGAADLNGDGVVDGADLATLLTNWGPV